MLVGLGGMGLVMPLAVVATGLAIAHLASLRIEEPRPGPGPGEQPGKRRTDLRGTLAIVRRIPGLPALIVFAAINNLLFGVFIALEDPYGLDLVPVEAWGILWAFISTAMIIGGMLVAKVGLGPLAQFVTIPLMTTGAGADLVGDWYGTGPDRGLTLLMTVFGLLGAGLTWAAVAIQRIDLDVVRIRTLYRAGA